MKPGTTEERKEAARRYLAEESINSIAEGMGRDPKTVRSWIKEQGIPLRPPGSPPSDVVAEAVHLYVDEKRSTLAVGLVLRLDPTTVARYLREAGVTLRSRGTPGHRRG